MTSPSRSRHPVVDAVANRRPVYPFIVAFGIAFVLIAGLLAWHEKQISDGLHDQKVHAAQIEANQVKIERLQATITQLEIALAKGHTDEAALRRLVRALQEQVRGLGGSPLTVAPRRQSAAGSSAASSPTGSQPSPASTNRSTSSPEPRPTTSPSPSPSPTRLIPCIVPHTQPGC